MAKPIPKSLYDADFYPLWRYTRRFVGVGNRLVPNDGDEAGHLTGGPSPHKGSKCLQCKRPLTLLWDLDLTDPMFPDYVREGFSPATRCPFYICWQCLTASYSVTADDRLQCFPFDGCTEYQMPGESPFEDSPVALPQRKIAWERIPSTIEALLTLGDCVGLDALDAPARGTIDAYYKRSMTSGWDLPFSQFGGQPLFYQGHSNRVCPNPKCPADQLEHPYGEMDVPYLMKEMAVIHHDNEPERAKHYFQLLYYICGICFSMRAEYRCS
jgi:hypothetical protein